MGRGRTVLRYARNPTDRWLTMSRTEIRIWNVLHEGPLEASEIVRRLPGVDYFEVMDAIHRMARAGDLKPITDD